MRIGVADPNLGIAVEGDAVPKRRGTIRRLGDRWFGHAKVGRRSMRRMEADVMEQERRWSRRLAVVGPLAMAGAMILGTGAAAAHEGDAATMQTASGGPGIA